LDYIRYAPPDETPVKCQAPDGMAVHICPRSVTGAKGAECPEGEACYVPTIPHTECLDLYDRDNVHTGVKYCASTQTAAAEGFLALRRRTSGVDICPSCAEFNELTRNSTDVMSRACAVCARTETDG